MKYIILTMMLLVSISEAGLPPTQTKADGEAGFGTTFKTDYDKIPVTRTGTEIKLGTIPISMGGTGEVTKSFVDLTTDQTIEGHKSFENSITSDNSNNGNLFVNPSFEYTLPTQGWTCAADTIVALSSDDFLTDGKKFLSITTEGIGEGCEQEVLIPTANIGKVYSVTIDAMASSVDYEVCRKEGAVEIECKNIENDIKPEKIGFIFNAKVKSNTFIARAKTIALGFMRLDNANFSMPNDNGLLLNIKQETGWTKLGTTLWSASTTAPTKGSIRFDDVYAKRNGVNLDFRITYNQTTSGTKGVGTYMLNLPTTFEGKVINFDNAAITLGTDPNVVIENVQVPDNMVGNFQARTTNWNGQGVVTALTGNRVAFKMMITPMSSDLSYGYWFGAMDTHDGFNNTSLKLVAEFSIPIAEWQDTFQAAGTLCKGGALKCVNQLTAEFTSANVASMQTPNGADWISCTGTSTKTCTYIGLNLVNPMTCSLTQTDDSGEQADMRRFDNTNTGFKIQQSNLLGAGTAVNFSVSCTKTGSDYNAEIEKWMPQNPIEDVRAEEFQVGYDYIVGKPIYRRCHRVASDISSGTLVTWTANLNPVNTVGFKAGGNRWQLMYYFWNTGDYLTVEYIKNTGAVNVGSVASALSAGTTICMPYTKP